MVRIMKENNIYRALNNSLLLTTLESTLRRSEYGVPLPDTHFGNVMYISCINHSFL